MSTTNEEKPKLSRRQLKAIPFLVSSPTYTQGCEKAKINKATLYKWLKQPPFKVELDRQRNEIIEAAFGMIAHNIEKAVSALVGLLDTGDDRVKRLTANDIIGHFLNHIASQTNLHRPNRIELRLIKRQTRRFGFLKMPRDKARQRA